jgi:hypothetical protein
MAQGRMHARLAKTTTVAGQLCPSLPVWLGLCASLLLMVGGVWDISWHRTVGRDTFWSPPHLCIYSGVGLLGLVCIAVVVRATYSHLRDSREDVRLVELWGLRAPLGFALAGFGVLGGLLSAPFDEWWHRTFGLDVTVWSPPHLLAIAASAMTRLGLVVALVHEMHAAGQRIPHGRGSSWRGTTVAEWVLLVLLSLLLGNLTFALGEYDYLEASREPVVYPMLASLAGPVVLIAGIHVLGRVGVATVIVLLFMGRRELMSAVLHATGFIPPSPTPLYLVPAVLLDGWYGLARRAPEPLWKNVAAGLLFGGSFVATEYVCVGYLTGSLWPTQAVLLGVPLAGLAGALSALIGHYLVRTWLAPGRAAME